jgi:hypothetical protein
VVAVVDGLTAEKNDVGRLMASGAQVEAAEAAGQAAPA